MTRKAFTMIEVMIVVVVAAILFVAALPDQKTADAQRGLNLAHKMEADIAYAQSSSISDPIDPVLMAVDVTADKYWLARQSDPSTPITHPRTGESFMVSTSNSAFRGVDIVAVDFNGDTVLYFDGMGAIDQDVPALIQIKSGSSRYEVSCIQTTGATKVASAYSKTIAANSAAAASGSTREVGGDVNTRAAVAADEDTNAVTDLVKGLLGR